MPLASDRNQSFKLHQQELASLERHTSTFCSMSGHRNIEETEVTQSMLRKSFTLTFCYWPCQSRQSSQQ